MHKFSVVNTAKEINMEYPGEEQILIPSSPIWPRSPNGIVFENGDVSPTTPGIYYSTIKSADGLSLRSK